MKKTPRKKVGMKNYTPTELVRGKVEGLTLAGATTRDISEMLAIPMGTLYRHYGEELKTSKWDKLERVAKNLYNTAINPESDPKAALTAQIFILKTQAGWKEKSAQEISGPEGEPLKIAAIGALVEAPQQETFEQFTARRLKLIDGDAKKVG